ncbi:MAG: [FeFe] hydrogenase H-cluster radical SAM maturase HydE [Spirochaetes bacterium]|nr:[FeFe] hydrogenase H-cluster radical SAM maturase HydE [Spirochaetota bacterium]
MPTSPGPSAASAEALLSLVEKARLSHRLTHGELVTLLAGGGADGALFAAADRVRREQVGEEVHLRGLIEFSNLCRQDCLYCGLRRSNPGVRRFQLAIGEILEMAREAAESGYRTVVLQSGESAAYPTGAMVELLHGLKALGLTVALSVGEKTRREYEAYRRAGADRYLLRIETTDARLYERMSPGMSWANRVRCLMDLRRLGYEVGTGCLVGLPGQSLASLADDLLFFQALDADMVGIGPFIPNPETPLGAAAPGSLALSMKMMALARLLLPDINIPATTAMEVLHPQGRLLALMRGANVAMPNATSGPARSLYALYPGKVCAQETPRHCRSCFGEKIQSLGRPIGTGNGARIRS